MYQQIIRLLVETMFFSNVFFLASMQEKLKKSKPVPSLLSPCFELTKELKEEEYQKQFSFMPLVIISGE